MPAAENPADLLIINGFRPIAGHTARLDQGPGKLVVTTGELDPNTHRGGRGTPAFAPIQQANDVPRQDLRGRPLRDDQLDQTTHTLQIDITYVRANA